MPQITIPNHIDTQFLANLANLGAAWGSIPDPLGNTQTFSFMTPYMDAVEQALEDYPAAYLAHIKQQKLEALADIRRVKEIEGPNGLVLDAQTIVRLTAASVGLMLDETRESVRWEMSRGNFIELPRATLFGLAVASVNRVQACFDTVYTKTQEIMAVELGEGENAILEALTTLNNIDLESGWPE